MQDHSQPSKMTKAQVAFWVGMTDQRVANMWEAADLIAGLGADGKEFFRAADPATFKFLKGLREEEVKDLAACVKYFIAFRTAFSFIFWGVGVLLAAFVAVITAWDKVSGLVKGAKS
jgi:hypothetical protein